MTTQRSSRFGSGWAVSLLLAAMIGVSGCDFLDPTEVENPRTTAEDLANAAEPTRALLPGLRAQFARMVSAVAVVQEVVSDNYSIHGTGLSGALDVPEDLNPGELNSTSTVTGVYWNAQELKALATFVLEDIVPDDETADAGDVAEAQYYRGMAYLTLGENFSYAPLESDGAAVPAAQILGLAVTDLSAAAAVGGEIGTAAQAGLARAQRWLGDAAAATTAANAVLNADDEFLFLREFDAGSVSNSPYFYLVSRALQEMQPLPRLDFLDPKYLDREQGIAVAKAEEMHLILAEAALAANDLNGAKTALEDAVSLALSRTTVGFFDDDPRLNADLSERPHSATIQVRADANAPFRTGLVLERPGNTTQYVISGTSLTVADVQALTTVADAWYTLHLARQEILFLEGRRMSDLGIRLPMMLREVDANPNINDGDPGTTPVVPSYIPDTNEMDLYTPVSPYDESGALVSTEITITHDMNRILAANQVTPFGSS